MKYKQLILSAFIITFVCGAVYIGVQQTYRQNANDPQIQIAEDVVAALARGAAPQTVVSSFPVIDMKQSLSPFIIITDESIKPITGSATLNSKIVLPMEGVFKSRNEYNQNRITWQPDSGVRNAIVVMHYQSGQTGGYVLVGRSLREIEARIDQFAVLMFIVWLFGLVAVTILSLWRYKGMKAMDIVEPIK